MWSVRKVEDISWLIATLDGATTISEDRVKIRIFVTDEEEDEAPSKSHSTVSKNTPRRSGSEDVEKQDKEIMLEADRPARLSALLPNVSFAYGRASFDGFLLDNLALASRNIVLGSGPAGFRMDLSNACARAQKRVLRGEIKEIALQCELFGW